MTEFGWLCIVCRRWFTPDPGWRYDDVCPSCVRRREAGGWIDDDRCIIADEDAESFAYHDEAGNGGG